MAKNTNAKEQKIIVRTIGFNGETENNKRVNESRNYIEEIAFEDEFLTGLISDGKANGIDIVFTKGKENKGYTMAVTVNFPKSLGGHVRVAETAKKDENIGKFFESRLSALKRRLGTITERNISRRFHAKNKQAEVAKKFGIAASPVAVKPASKTVKAVKESDFGAEKVNAVEEYKEKMKPIQNREIKKAKENIDHYAETGLYGTHFENMDALIKTLMKGKNAGQAFDEAIETVKTMGGTLETHKDLIVDSLKRNAVKNIKDKIKNLE